MVRMITAPSNLNGNPSGFKSSFYSEAEHDIKQYKKSDEDFSHLANLEPIEDTGKVGYKNPGWKAIHQFCKAVNNEELTRDDFGLYDVADEHQAAYYHLCSLKPEDMGERVVRSLDLLHSKRDQQIRDRDYDPDSKGQFRSPGTRRSGNYTYSDEQISKAVKVVLDGGTIRDAASEVDADYSHLANVLKSKYKFVVSKLVRAANSAKGMEILKKSTELGMSRTEVARRMGIDHRTASNYVKLYRSGEPITYELSAETRKVLEKCPPT